MTTRATAGPYLTFNLGSELFAVAVKQVREIIEFAPPTRVPSTPACILGVLNLRGTVVPIVDLAIKFGGAPTPVTNRTCTVIVEVTIDGDRIAMGIVAESVDQVAELAADDIEKPPSFGIPVRIDYLLGMARVAETFALILDIDKILSTEELLAALEEEPQALDTVA
jgi:purine-binding chemotaxis protein CheW